MVVRGSRQVGKTYLIREFGKAEYENYLEINFERERELGGFLKKSDSIAILPITRIKLADEKESSFQLHQPQFTWLNLYRRY